MSLLSILQEAAQREREARTILRFLNEEMDGVDERRRRRSFKERLGFKVMSCCGASWGFRDEEHDGEREEQMEVMNTRRSQEGSELDRICLSPLTALSPANSGMNLATALAEERRLRASPHAPEQDNNDTVPERRGSETPWRVSLMRLLEETDGGDRKVGEKKSEDVGSDSVCCVCMRREKGAAFIPCGHTFCRVCSRELWLNRGSCPLCNRPILEILDIF